jgi:hypothetical protein
VEHDSVVSLVARKNSSISERVSGSGRKQLQRLDLAAHAYQRSLAADVLGDGTGWARPMEFVPNLMRIKSGAIRCAIPVELVRVKSNSRSWSRLLPAKLQLSEQAQTPVRRLRDACGR